MDKAGVKGQLTPGGHVDSSRGETQSMVGTYRYACSKYTSNVNAADSAKTAAIVTTVIGGAAVAATFVYYFDDKGGEKRSASRGGIDARIVPWTATGARGLGAVGRF